MRTALLAILFLAFLSAPDLKAQSADASALPAPIAKLLPDIQEKKHPEEIRCLFIKNFGKPWRRNGIPEWYAADGIITFHRSSLPYYHDKKSNKKYWLMKTNTQVEENVFARYRMESIPNGRWLGNLTIDSDLKYSFEVGQKSDNLDNFFLRHQAGKVSVTYPGSVKPDTPLASLEENATIAQLVFTSNDGEHSPPFSIVSSKESNALSFVGNGDMPFSMQRYWKIFKPSKPIVAAASDSFPPEPIVKLASEIQEALLRENTDPDDIRCQIILSLGSPHRQSATSVTSDHWDMADGVLTFNPSAAPRFFDTKLKKTYWMIKTKNSVEDNISGRYGLRTTPDKNNHGTVYFIGDLTIDSDFKYSFKSGRKIIEHFFVQHNLGKVSVNYLGSVKPETLLESLEENTAIAQLVFTSDDGKHSATYDIATSNNSRSLISVGNEEMTFYMHKFWKNNWK